MAGFPLFESRDKRYTDGKLRSASGLTNVNLSIYSLVSKKTIVFSPFVESFNFKLSKTSKFVKFDEVNLNSGVLEGPTRISISITLNIPASTSTEAFRNYEKLEEIQRMINPVQGYNDSKSSVFVVLSNLISQD